MSAPPVSPLRGLHFVSPAEVPLPPLFVQREVDRAQRRWLVFTARGLVCATDDVASLIRWSRESGEEAWVTLGKILP